MSNRGEDADRTASGRAAPHRELAHTLQIKMDTRCKCLEARVRQGHRDRRRADSDFAWPAGVASRDEGTNLATVRRSDARHDLTGTRKQDPANRLEPGIPFNLSHRNTHGFRFHRRARLPRAGVPLAPEQHDTVDRRFPACGIGRVRPV